MHFNSKHLLVWVIQVKYSFNKHHAWSRETKRSRLDRPIYSTSKYTLERGNNCRKNQVEVVNRCAEQMFLVKLFGAGIQRQTGSVSLQVNRRLQKQGGHASKLIISTGQRELPAPDLHPGTVWETASWANQAILMPETVLTTKQRRWSSSRVKEQSLVMFIW